VEGDIADFLGVKIERSEDGRSFNLTQPHLIDDILKELRLEADKTAIKKTTTRPTEANLRTVVPHAVETYMVQILLYGTKL
jgi:hypothetical protein